MAAVTTVDGPSAAARPSTRDEARRDFEEFCAAHSQGLTMQLYAYLGDLHEAQDMAQEAFCRAYAKWSRISQYDQPSAWVRRVAWNLATSRLRRQRTAFAFLSRQREEHMPGPGPDRVALVSALATLPPQQRRVIVLHHMGQLTVPEIAEQEGVPEGTVKSWLSRARTTLAARLADDKKGTRHV